MIKGTSNYENLTILLTSRVSALTVGAVELLLRKTAFNFVLTDTITQTWVVLDSIWRSHLSFFDSAKGQDIFVTLKTIP